VNRYGAGFLLCPVLEFSALPDAAVIGPVGAATGLGVGEREFTPFTIGLGQAGEVRIPQVGDFLRPECGLIHAAEECLEPLATLAIVLYRVEKPAGLAGIDDASRVNGLEFPGTAPRDRLERVARQ
jgi:hypothetical protein